MAPIKFLFTGDTSLTVEFGNEISPAINAQIRAFGLALMDSGISGLVELVPTYRSVTIHYDPAKIRHEALVSQLNKLLRHMDEISLPPSQVLEIPVLYGGEMGPDLGFVAENSGKTPQEVIDIHTSTEYLIYMLGFTPGFTYLGGMNEEIATPRLKTPRVKIDAGSVGIAGSQTGVYPIDSPGGWQIIGRTPVLMYDPDREPPILPTAGDYMKFRAIDQGEFDRIAKLAKEGAYTCRRYSREEARQ